MENNSMPAFPQDYTVAMAYVPWQKLEDVYDPETALRYGTLFPELNKPFLGGRHHG